jgi:hypothetical protein
VNKGGSSGTARRVQAPILLLIPWSPSKNFCHGCFEEERLEVKDDDKLAT